MFTTIQKFLPEEKGDRFPMLSDRTNVIVIADEAHRTQYGFVDGFARNMRSALPNATFIAFTGTPVELEDRDTRLVFGDYIDVYDVRRAEEDGAIVPINFESRLAKLDLPEAAKPRIDDELEEVTEAEESEDVEKLKARWTQLEAVAGTRRRLELVAQDLVQHWERRRGKLPGKAMVVCMSRRICVELYDEILKLRPEWHSDSDEEGTIKVMMTGSAGDPAPWQRHIRNSSRRKELGDRFKDPDDRFEVADAAEVAGGFEADEPGLSAVGGVYDAALMGGAGFEDGFGFVGSEDGFGADHDLAAAIDAAFGVIDVVIAVTFEHFWAFGGGAGVDGLAVVEEGGAVGREFVQDERAGALARVD